jgi:hypothetical protein
MYIPCQYIDMTVGEIPVEKLTKAVDIKEKSRLNLIGSRLSGVVFLFNPCCPNPTNAGLDRLVSGGYDLLVK